MSIRVDHAECWIGCDDPDCPYTHHDCWVVTEEDTGWTAGPFHTEGAAREHDEAHRVQESQP